MSRPKTIVFTGGACAGKTTALVRIRELLMNLGWHTIIVPEAATLVFGGAGRPDPINRALLVCYQKALINTQIFLENMFATLATGDKTVIITDRGALDGKAFVSKAEWQHLLKELNLDEVELRDLRYDAIIHLVTAADGALAAYKLEGVRNETPEQAVVQDKALQRAYLGHGHHKIIGNRGNFNDKLHQIEEEVCNFLGLPEPLELERKFLVEKMPVIPVDSVSSTIEQTYLFTAPILRESRQGEERRLRKRTQDGTSVYSLGYKRVLGPGKKIEREESIRASEYAALLNERNPNQNTIHKIRHCFIHNHRCWELDVYQSPRIGLVILEVEVPNFDEKLKIPSWLGKVTEVTQDSSYSNFSLSFK